MLRHLEHPASLFSSLSIFLLASVVAVTSASASYFQSILVDADSSDWAGISATHVDPPGDNGSSTIDLGQIFIANDDEFVYLRFEVGGLVGIQTLPSPMRLHFDVDNDDGTGYPVLNIGSELMIEFSPGGSGMDIYEQTSSSFRAATIGFGPFDTYQGPTVAATSFEVRLRRDTMLPVRGTIAFPGSGTRVALDASGGEVAPNGGGGIFYALASGTPPGPPDNDLAKFDAGHIRVMSFNTHNGEMFLGEAARGTRILQAIQPDVIAFQELWDFSVEMVENRLDQDLPLDGGAHWQALKRDRGQITASRFPMTLDVGAPSLELATLVDLPDADYTTDLYVINSHFKCCGSLGSSEDLLRQQSADAMIAWYRDLQTPGGAELPEDTPIVNLGDFNLVGGPQPMLTLLTGNIIDQGSYGTDYAPDWDGTDNQASLPVHSDGLASYTWRNDFSSFGPGKMDFIFITDSVAELGNHFILNTADMSSAKLAALGLLANDSREVSDHMATVQDLAPLSGAVAIGDGPANPAALRLRAFPNPFTSMTHIALTLPEAAEVRARVFDPAGRLVRNLATGRLEAGDQALRWDGRDEEGEKLGPGLYFLLIETRSGHGSRMRADTKLVLTR
jgi:endonuclease/exonuclease/phosphatase family metal-dependent hydrolase